MSRMIQKDTVIRISQITKPEPDIAVIVAVWGPSNKDETHSHSVRGVPIQRTTVKVESGGRLYRWCIFPDGRVMLVNEGNIDSRRIKGSLNVTR